MRERDQCAKLVADSPWRRGRFCESVMWRRAGGRGDRQRARRAGKPARFRRTSTAQVLGEQYVFARWAAGWDGGLRLTIPMTAFEQGLRAGREGAGWIREPEQQPVLHHSQNVHGGRKDSRSNWSGLLVLLLHFRI
jgi:hypothetical protein